MKQRDTNMKNAIKMAAALKYDEKKDNAPRVVGLGKGKLAERIVAIAEEKGVPVYNDPELVKELVKLDISQEIPPHLYEIVARILVFVYNLDKKQSARKHE